MEARNAIDFRRRLCTAIFAVAALAAVALTVLASPTSAQSGRFPNFFGVSPTATVTPADVDRMAAAGVGTMRLPLRWSLVQRQQGDPYDWRRSDVLVEAAARNGVRVLPFLFGAPPWAAPTTTSAPLATAEARAGWRAFATAAVQRYGREGSFWAEHPDIPPQPFTAWEIWNEQNSPAFWGNQTPSPRQYATLLRIASEAIKETNPGVRVIVGGLVNGAGMSTRAFLHGLYEVRWARHWFNGVGVHPYSPSPRQSMKQMRDVRRLLIRHRDRRVGLWVTEIGWTSAETGSRLSSTPAGQASKLDRAFAKMRRHRGRWNIKRVVWFTWEDDHVNPVCSWCEYAGLTESDGTAKPAWSRYVKYTGGQP